MTDLLDDEWRGSSDGEGGLRPALVAVLRGVLEAAVLAAIGAAVVALGDLELGAGATWAPVAVLVLRTLEGVADERIDPTRQRAPLGGRSAP